MRRTLFSQHWHNVAQLRPKLAPHTRTFRHVYRGQAWFVLQDAAGNRYHRVSPTAHTFINHMDGNRTVQSIWDNAHRIGGDEIPTQDEVVQLLMQLHANDLLYCDVSPDAAELFERYSKRRSAKWKQMLLNPTSLRIPLFNPDKFLSYLSQRAAWLTSVGWILWLIVVTPALFLAGQHWSELTENLSDRILSSSNLFALALIYPFVKLLHELGHGVLTKIWGGTVHEMGVMFLFFTPVPYVDTSSSSTFHSKYQRAIVGAGGMLVELFIAAIAMYIWLTVEPGVVRAATFNIMLIAGVSTLAVNGNPLLRYDAYYILSDLIEIPNLAQRGQAYLKYLSDRCLFGAKELESPQETPSEKKWLFIYTIASWFYKILISISISLFIATKLFFFGILLALWSGVQLLVLPVWKSIHHILYSPTLRKQRGKAIKLSLITTAIVLLIFSFVPLPLRTQAEGVVWLPEQSLVRAGVNGFLQRSLIEPGSYVSKGTPVLLMDDPDLEAELAVANAKVIEAEQEYRAKQFSEPASANVLAQKLVYEKQKRDRIDERHSHLVVYSNTNGVLTIDQPKDLSGRFCKKGELLGYALNQRDLIIRVAINQENIDLIRTHLKGIEIRLSYSIGRSYTITSLREVTGGLNELPTKALSTVGGGKIAIDPNDSKGLKTLERVFLFDLPLPSDVPTNTFGQRVFVRFEHQPEPVFTQIYRRIRQLFLSRFNV